MQVKLTSEHLKLIEDKIAEHEGLLLRVKKKSDTDFLSEGVELTKKVKKLKQIKEAITLFKTVMINSEEYDLISAIR